MGTLKLAFYKYIPTLVHGVKFQHDLHTLCMQAAKLYFCAGSSESTQLHYAISIKIVSFIFNCFIGENVKVLAFYPAFLSFFATFLPLRGFKSLFNCKLDRGEFNNAKARRALVDWYLSLFVMCKAWQQYNER